MAGTTLVRAFSPSEGRTLGLIPANSFLYFETGGFNAGSTLWRTDGTPAGTFVLRDFRDGGNSVAASRSNRFSGRHLRDALAIGDTLYITEYTTAHGLEIWKSDGTTAGTVEVADLVANPFASGPTSFEAVGNLLTFGLGFDLWRTDGTAAGTTIVSPPQLMVGTDRETVVAGGNLFFNGLGSPSGVYKYDGVQMTLLAPSVFLDLLSGDYAVVGHTLYSRELGSGSVWRSDGTPGGTGIVGETYPSGSTDARRLIGVGGAIVFWANNPTYGREPWRIGTPVALPVAIGDAYSTGVGVTLNVPAPGVLANDAANGGALSAMLAAGPAHGTVSLGTDGAFTYVPSQGFTGTDTFSYVVVNGNGTSSPATVTITVSIPGPQPPTSLAVSSVVGNVVTLQWTPPATGLPPTQYLLEGGVSPGQVLASIPTGSTNPTFTFTGPTGTFYLRMRTAAGALTSGVSNEIVVYVNVPAPPSAPVNLLGLVNGSTLGLSWRNTFSGGTPLGVILDVSGALSGSLPLGLVDSFQFGGIPPGTYTFSVRAQNGGGASAASNAVTLSFPSPCSGVPLTPLNLRASATGNVLTLAWDPPSSGSAVSGYVLTVSGAFTGVVSLPTTSISAPVPSGTYNFTVAASNACGASTPTAVASVTVGAVRPTPP